MSRSRRPSGTQQALDILRAKLAERKHHEAMYELVIEGLKESIDQSMAGDPHVCTEHDMLTSILAEVREDVARLKLDVTNAQLRLDAERDPLFRPVLAVCPTLEPNTAGVASA